MSTAMWKLEKDLCRCCHAEGSFKHLSDPCFLLGQEEIYSIMLQDCLDIKIDPITGALSDATYTICESCVARLRDASNFKRQVQDCEERFKDMYSKNLIKGFEVKDEPFESDTDMKQEFQSVEEEDEDDDDAFMKFDDDLEDDSTEDHEETITVDIAEEPRSKGKGKAKPKPKSKKMPIKKSKREKPIKLESEELTEAAVSGEKKKGPASDYLNYCSITEEDDSIIYTCNLCSKTYSKKEPFRQHLRQVHLGLRKKTFPCVLCKKQLIPNQRAKHMEEAHGWQAPTCLVCDKKFAYENQLRRHQRVSHLGEKDFQCEHCDKAYPTWQRLKVHSARHSDVRPYTCEYCSRTYKTMKYLRSHLKVHAHEGRYLCGICGTTFVLAGSLNYHMKKQHPDDDDSNDASLLLITNDSDSS